VATSPKSAFWIWGRLGEVKKYNYPIDVIILRFNQENIMPPFILTVHSILRWVTIIVAVAALIKYAIGWLGKKPFDNTTARLTSAYKILMDVQLLIGVFYLVLGGLMGIGFPSYRIVHTVFMVVAVVLAHLITMWKDKGDEVRYRNGFFMLLASVLMVMIGVSLLPGGRWFHIAGLF
jgi:hypothetical protein